MKIKNLDSWEEFENVVKENENETDTLKNSPKRISSTTQIIYRGQADSRWSLKSILERKAKKDITVDSYFDLMLKVWNSSVDTYKEKWANLEKEIKDLKIENIYDFLTLRANSRQIISFMAHLRQYGFPSPLLDWTENSLIAAFFAFENIPDSAEKVAIYTFREYTGYPSDMSNMLEPTTIGIGNNIPGIERHQKQKAHYTLCIQQDDIKDFKNARFANVEKDINKSGFYIDGNGNDIDLDLVRNVTCKYTIPVSERNKVLKKLQGMNINRSFLFDETEDNRLFDYWTKISIDAEI